MYHRFILDFEDACESSKDDNNFVVESKSKAEHEDGELESEDDFEWGKYFGERELIISVVSNNIHEESTRQPHEITQPSLNTSTESELSVILYLFYAIALDDFLESDLPSVQFDEFDAFDYFCCNLNSFIFEYINFLYQFSVSFRDKIR